MNMSTKNISMKMESGLEKIEEFTLAKDLYEILIKKIKAYHPSDDISMIEKAYQISYEAHKEQKRKSGEPYIIHPICVAIILAELELDKETIAAGLMHDVIEDTDYTYEDIKELFSEDVANLVEGVTKLTQISWTKDKIEMQAENLRKMFLAMAKDIRVILIKLADRLHNMRTLQHMKEEKQKEKAKETMEIYAPIAQRLGISKVKVELDDLSLKYLEKEKYNDLARRIELKKEEREAFVTSIMKDLMEQLEKAGIKAELSGRVKHFFSIYKKMVNQEKTLEQIYDLFAVRVIVDNVKDCYATLGIIHEMYKPIPGRFKDYIAMPKANMYQSLHTTLISHTGQPFEMQIRTFDMHKTAEYGIAAHWKYKESGSGKVAEGAEAEKMNWLREILDWQKNMSDNREFLSVVKNDFDLFSDSVYCFTPSGDVKNLPRGSTPIDFAYMIHSAVGNKMVGAKVNGRLVTIDYTLANGDRIEILTSQNSKGPSRDWLNIVKSTQAKNKINQWFKNASKEDNIEHGKILIEKYTKSKNINWYEINKPEYQEKVMKRYAYRDWESILAGIGHGALKEGQVVNKMLQEFKKNLETELSDDDILASISSTKTSVPKKSISGITVRGIHDLAVRFSRCCSPVPGDEIVGFVTRGRGISIHRTDCINILNLPEEEVKRLMVAQWEALEDDKLSSKYQTEIKIYANNRVGMFVDISKIFTEKEIDIISMNSRTNKQGLATINMSFEIKGTMELSSLIAKLRQIEGIIDIERTSS